MTERKYLWRGFAAVVLVYVISHLLMFAIDGVCWDDSLIWNNDRNLFEYYFGLESCNNHIEYWYQTAVLDNFSVPVQLLVFRLMAFLAGLSSAIAVWMLSGIILGRNSNAALWISLLFAACSVDRTGMMITCLHYSFSNMLALWGMVAIASDYKKDSLYMRLLAALLWTVALLLWRSAVLLIPAVIVTLCCFKTKFRFLRLSSWKDAVKYAFTHYWMIILACVIYAVSFMTWAHPKSFVDEYTTMPIKNIVLSPVTATMTSLHVLCCYLGNLCEAFAFGDSLLSVGTIVCAIVIYWMSRKCRIHNVGNEKRLLILAAVFMIFGIWPQMLIKSVIYYVDIHSTGARLASLLPLPICCIIVLAASHCSDKVGRIAMSVILSAALFHSVSVFVDYDRGQQKNTAIENFFRENPCLAGRKLLILDNTAALNSFPGDYMRHYEYESLAAHVYGYGLPTSVSLVAADGDTYDYVIRIDYGAVLYSPYRLFAYKYIAPERYRAAVDAMLNISYFDKLWSQL